MFFSLWCFKHGENIYLNLTGVWVGFWPFVADTHLPFLCFSLKNWGSLNQYIVFWTNKMFPLGEKIVSSVVFIGWVTMINSSVCGILGHILAPFWESCVSQKPFCRTEFFLVYLMPSELGSCPYELGGGRLLIPGARANMEVTWWGGEWGCVWETVRRRVESLSLRSVLPAESPLRPFPARPPRLSRGRGAPKENCFAWACPSAPLPHSLSTV